MQVYLVGGAVRDRLLDLPVHDRDWVVVGSSASAMEAAGYKTVGRDFPVFLHPQTHEEYALARTERKTAPGYRGFSIHAEPGVTLEEDLERRDITINAIAEDSDGNLIDPFGGTRDIEQRIIRHVSAAFAEDPVRILRVARFAARLQGFGFRVADETFALMRQMVASGEVDALVPERVWQELRTALLTSKPSVFFDILREAGALQALLPEVDCLFGIPQTAEHHPEIDAGIHTMMVLDQACKIAESQAEGSGQSIKSFDESFEKIDQATAELEQAKHNRRARIGLAALCHDLGKAVTPRENWPSHYGHEKAGVPIVEALCQRLRVPNDCKQLAVVTCHYHLHCHRAQEMKASTLVSTLASLDALRKPERFEEFLLVCEADYRGRKGLSDREYPQAALLKSACQAAQSVDAGEIAQSIMNKRDSEKTANSHPSEAIKNEVHAARVTAVKSMLRSSRQ